MRKFYTTLLSCVLSLVCVTAFADQLTLSQALIRLNSAGGHHNRVQQMVSSNERLSLTYTCSESGRNLFYVVTDQSRTGSLIVSADDCAPALLAMVDGEFDIDKIPTNMKWWLDQYASAIKTASVQGVQLTAARAGSHDPVAPLLTCTWNQTAPFNADCNDIPGIQSVTGCVATAMAQVMYYHKWPTRGTGSHSYSYNLNTGSGIVTVTPSADFGATTYRWDSMKDQYSSTDADPEVARLMHHCGVAVDMQYLGGASTAFSINIGPALYNYFGYDAAMTYKSRILYTDEQWTDMLVSELAAGRPVIYGGSTRNQEGHSFVIDGYDGTDFHVNWGWGGYLDGYFTIIGEDALNPEGSGTGGGTPGMGYVVQQEMLTGIQKAQSGSRPSISMNNLTSLTLSHSSATHDDHLTLHGEFAYNSIVNCAVEVGAMLKETTTGTSYYCKCPQAYQLSAGQYLPNITIELCDALENGTYEVYPVFRVAGGANAEWTLMGHLPTGYTVPRVTISGATASLVVTDAYMTTPENTTRLDNMALHISLSAMEDVNNAQLVAFIFGEESASNLDAATAFITMQKGETQDITLNNWQWNLSNLSENRSYTYLLQCNGKTIPTTSMTSYVRFQVSGDQPALVNVTFDVDGTTSTQQVAVGEPIPAPTTPEKEGYTFAGWNPAFNPGDLAPDTDITYTAQWTVNTYTVFYRVNGEIVDTKEAAYLSDIPAATYESADPAVVINGWKVDGDFTTVPAHDIYVDAIVAHRVEITFVIGTEQQTDWYNAGSPLVAPDVTAPEGYTFTGWDPAIPEDATVPETDATYTAQWTVNTYTVFYRVNGEVVDTKEAEYLSDIPAATYESADPAVVISGWKVDGDFTTVPAHDIYVDAIVAHRVEITFVIGAEQQTDWYNTGSPLVAPDVTAPEGYTFAGWNPAIPEDATVPETDTTYEAQFTPLSFTVHYMFNGEEVGTQTVLYGTDIPSFDYQPSDPRYTITAWRSDADYTTMPAHDITYTADFADSIEHVSDSHSAHDIYTLSGIKVTAPQRGNIYIINGKKVRK